MLIKLMYCILRIKYSNGQNNSYKKKKKKNKINTYILTTKCKTKRLSFLFNCVINSMQPDLAYD